MDHSPSEPTETSIRPLIGRTIVAARYVGLPADATERSWNAGNFDSIDFGVEMDLDDGATWAITWLSPNWRNGLLVFPGEMTRILSSANLRVWDVSRRWQQRATTITAIETAWETFTPLADFPSDAEPTCLQTLVLRTADGDVVIGLGDQSVDGSNELAPSADNIVVFFSKDTARSAGLWMVP